MRCKDCIAKQGKADSCLAGAAPYTLKKNGELGCCYSRAQIVRYMRDKGILVAEQKEERTTVKEIDYNELYSMWYRCQKCRSTMITRSAKYCPNCGRKIRWPKAKKGLIV